MAITERLKNRIANIETKSEYDEVLYSIQMSNAPIETREEAIRYLKAQCSQFDETAHNFREDVIRDIQEGMADIDDIGGY